MDGKRRLRKLKADVAGKRAPKIIGTWHADQLEDEAALKQACRNGNINFLKALNSSEDAHLKSMSTFEADEHLQARGSLAVGHSRQKA